ncbi:dihydroorotate dehydrogenase electron transfer subunit [Paenibacillus sp. Marseille-Q4541]|uniref:dihydroorotate dehydrogenase electron transfer subunit n=1 Tax=Paenibacillus sp. Marseille-Q4541 TaxID=2831522 RepID=UPI001BAADA44|nr:dihydroorotate dehydrogenase electron transfer subunit [Paenibacillus sp. Marseille-Q4541]
MAKVISNVHLNEQVGLLEVECDRTGKPGQFYMLRAWDTFPLLPRPISIFDITDRGIRFLYQVVGEGTLRLYQLRVGDNLTLEGPFGNGFPELNGKIALVGGGIGIAPFYYAAKSYENADVYLGFSDKPYLVDEFRQVSPSVTVDVGGTILDYVRFEDYDHVIACGPQGMLKAIQAKQAAEQTGTNIYVSLENKMACGVGACLACSIKHKSGRKKSCTDGPVFRAEEVSFI